MMWHASHRGSETKVYFLKMQTWTRVAQDKTQSGARCEVQQRVWDTLVNVALSGDSSGNVCFCERHT